jgi:hypothetical protein
MNNSFKESDNQKKKASVAGQAMGKNASTH